MIDQSYLDSRFYKAAKEYELKTPESLEQPADSDQWEEYLDREGEKADMQREADIDRAMGL